MNEEELLKDLEKYFPIDLLTQEEREYAIKLDREFGILSKEGESAYRAVRILKSDINSIEVKEVDLKKEIQSWVEDNSVNGYYHEDVYETAKHFFELGLKTQKID